MRPDYLAKTEVLSLLRGTVTHEGTKISAFIPFWKRVPDKWMPEC